MDSYFPPKSERDFLAAVADELLKMADESEKAANECCTSKEFVMAYVAGAMRGRCESMGHHIHKYLARGASSSKIRRVGG